MLLRIGEAKLELELEDDELEEELWLELAEVDEPPNGDCLGSARLGCGFGFFSFSFSSDDAAAAGSKNYRLLGPRSVVRDG